MLMPAGVLIVLVLSAITMDLSLVHLARREVVAAAEAAANDAATYGLSERAYRRGDGYALDPRRVDAAVVESLEVRGLRDDLARPPEVVIVGTTVQVRLTTRVQYVFARALPGVAHDTVVSATGSATPVAR
jgi:Flp pilus assembly protein TadG